MPDTTLFTQQTIFQELAHIVGKLSHYAIFVGVSSIIVDITSFTFGFEDMLYDLKPNTKSIQYTARYLHK